MPNIALMNLRIEKCSECPFCRMEGTATCHKGPWAFELDPGSDVVPNNCPILLDNWREFLSFVSEQKKGAVYSAIRHIETELQASVGVTELFNIDHGRGHIDRVTKVGLRFIDRLASFGLDDGSEKTKIMFKVAAAMHDIGLKPSNHAAKSSSMAKDVFLRRNTGFDSSDIDKILHAIRIHTDKDCSQVENIIDAALLLANKLDITRDRVVFVRGDFARECNKIHRVQYDIVGKAGRPKGAELCFETDVDFDIHSFYRVFPDRIKVPYYTTTKILGLKEFRLFLNGSEVLIPRILV